MSSFIIECRSCVVRGPECHECVVSVLLGPPERTTFEPEEQAALKVLADSGMIPPLRLVTAVEQPASESA